MMQEKEQRMFKVECLKLPMVMFNFIFWLSGLAMVGVGIWTLIYENEYHVLLASGRFLIIVGLMTGIGGVIIIICTCGCYGTIKEHRYLLISFLIMLTLVFVIELSVGIVAFVHRAEIKHELHTATKRKMNDYGNSEKITNTFDRLQMTYKCCGDTSFASWNATAWKQSDVSRNNSVPDSCCKTPSEGCGKRDHPSNIHRKGCLDPLTVLFKEYLLILGSLLLGIAALQLIGLVMTACLLRFVDDYY